MKRDQQAIVPAAVSDAADSASYWLLERKGKYQKKEHGHAHMTPRTNLVLAVRRNIGNVSATTMGATLLDDVDGKTVRRAEEKCGSALIASFRDFHDRLEVVL